MATQSCGRGIFQRDGESRIVASHSASVRMRANQYRPGGSSGVGSWERIEVAINVSPASIVLQKEENQ
jgi:hypothetical protein